MLMELEAAALVFSEGKPLVVSWRLSAKAAPVRPARGMPPNELMRLLNVHTSPFFLQFLQATLLASASAMLTYWAEQARLAWRQRSQFLYIFLRERAAPAAVSSFTAFMAGSSAAAVGTVAVWMFWVEVDMAAVNGRADPCRMSAPRESRAIDSRWMSTGGVIKGVSSSSLVVVCYTESRWLVSGISDGWHKTDGRDAARETSSGHLQVETRRRRESMWYI